MDKGSLQMAESAKHVPPKTCKWRSRPEALACLYSLFSPKDRVLITIDPDPDSIASALALKRLLWRKVYSTTITLIRPIRRLNNLAMVRLLRLRLPVMEDEKDMDEYDKYLLVDGQPHHNPIFSRFSYTAIIDHHPLTDSVEAPFVDIRPHYGSTSTIFTEYLKCASIKPSRTLATALIYGIKTDTRNFERNSLEEDVKAFRNLFPLANHNVLRKIEISDLALKDLKVFQKAIERKHVVRDRIFTHLEKVDNADILVVIADFLLKVHDISWSIVSGLFEDRLVIIVRNDGYRKDAGRSLKNAFDSIGSAGGHKAMGRAEIPVENLKLPGNKLTSRAIESFVRKSLSPYS
jgi:nanoRNase/pAp phosphatase (c-di-AMP/oligoRNAs hydrolase)